MLDLRAEALEQIGDYDACRSDREAAEAVRKDWPKDSLKKRARVVAFGLKTRISILLLLVLLLGDPIRILILILLFISLVLVGSVVGMFAAIISGMTMYLLCTPLIFILGLDPYWAKTPGQPVRIETQTFKSEYFDLSDWKGKTVLIYSVTPGSSKSEHDLPIITDLYKKYPRDKFEVLGIINSGSRKVFEDTNGITTSAWPLISGYNLDRATIELLGDLEDQKSYVLSPLDQHMDLSIILCQR